MSLFFAIDLPTKVKESIDDQIDDLKKKYPQFNWIPKENFHISLLFLGDDYSLGEIDKRIEKLFFDKDKFRLYSQSLDLFIGKKIIAYLSFQREKHLSELVNELYDSFNMSFEGKYIPHLTLSRYKIPSKQQYFVIKKTLQNFDIEIEFEVSGISLLESLTEDGRLIYKRKNLYKFGQ